MDRKNILEQINVVEVVQNWLSLQKKGNNYVGLCPFHEDTKPSLFVSENKQIFKCFSCNTGGDGIKFVMLIENCSFQKAVITLAKQFNIKLDNSWEAENKLNQNDQKIIEINEESQVFFQFNLINTEDDQLQKYCQKRKITPQIRDQFQIGWSGAKGEKLWNYLQKKQFNALDVLNSGLFYLGYNNKPTNYFKEQLIFPIKNEDSKTVGFVGRIITEKGAEQIKYLNSKESNIFSKNKCLYNLDYVRKNFRGVQELYIVEGIFDSIHLINNKKPAAALMGTNLSQEQVSILKESFSKIVIFPDNDPVGKESAIKNSLILLKNKIKVHIIKQTKGKDADECLQLTNFDWSKDVKQLTPAEFIIDQFPQIENSKQIEKLINQIKPFFTYLDSIQTFQIKKQMEVKYNIPITAFETIKGEETTKQQHPVKPNKQKEIEEWKEILFAKMLYHPEIIKKIIKVKGTFNDLEYDLYFDKLVQWYNQKNQQEQLSINYFLISLDENGKKWISTLYNKNKNKKEVTDGNIQFIMDCLRKFELESLNLQIHNLKKKIKAGKTKDFLKNYNKLIAAKRKILTSKRDEKYWNVL